MVINSSYNQDTLKKHKFCIYFFHLDLLNFSFYSHFEQTTSVHRTCRAMATILQWLPKMMSLLPSAKIPQSEMGIII